MRAPAALHHLGVDTEFLAVVDGKAVILCGIGVQHRRDVVLGVASGEQHAGDGQDAGNTLFAQLVEADMDDRDWRILGNRTRPGTRGIEARSALGDLGEFFHRQADCGCHGHRP